MAASAIALLAATLLFHERFGLRAFAVTLAAVAIAEAGLGVGLYLRTRPQVERLAGQLARDPAAFRTEEGARMARVQKNFVTIQCVEVAVIIICSLIALTQKAHPVRVGVALALLIHASALLAFDLVAERRGDAYLSTIADDAVQVQSEHR